MLIRVKIPHGRLACANGLASMERTVSAHLYGVLKERLQNSDKQGAIDLYYELLSSGHSVGDILNAVGPLRNDSDHDNSSLFRHPQSTAHGAAAIRAAELEATGAAQAGAQDTDGLRLFDNTEIHRPEKSESSEKHEPVKATANDELGPDNREQLFPENLTRSGLDIVKSEETHISTSCDIAIHSGDQKPFRPGKRPVIGKQIAFVAIYTAIIASASIAGFSILTGGRNAEPTTARIQSEVAGGTEAAAIPGSVKVRSGSAATTPTAKKQVVNAISSHAPQPSKNGEPDSIALGLLHKTAAGGRAKTPATGPDTGASQDPIGGQRDTTGGDTIEKSHRAAAISPESAARPPTPSVARSPSPDRVGALEIARHSVTGQPDEHEPVNVMEVAPSDTEPTSMDLTQAAEAGHNPEPVKGPATEAAETAKPASAKTVKSAPDIAAPVSGVAADAERPLEFGRGITSAENSDDVDRTKQPDTVLPPPGEAAVALPRAADVTAQERRFKNAEAEALLARGDAFLATGDLASARLFYESAVAAGNGMAALRLGGTFDPAFLMRARIGRVQGDLPSALYWYRRARDLGNDDAEILLKNMENTAR
jgi:hypothetical protein